MLIKPAYIDTARNKPLKWLDLRQGAWLCEQERQALTPFWPSLAGQYALTLGPLSPSIASSCKAVEVISVHAGESARVKAQLDALPFAKRSIDIAVLAHVLEYTKDPHQVLREADRCLAFDGYMVLTAYNPHALATLTGWLPGNAGKAPWNGRSFSRHRVEDWLSLLNYEVLEHGYVGNGALWKGSGKPAEYTDNPICRAFAWLRCSYFIIARKRVFPLTPSPGFLRFARAMPQPQAVQARSFRPVDKH